MKSGAWIAPLFFIFWKGIYLEKNILGKEYIGKGIYWESKLGVNYISKLWGGIHRLGNYFFLH